MISTKKYNIIYADPPWHFQNYNNDKAQTNPANHYPTMTMKDIENLPIGELADKDCVLFMWCTDPLLHKQIPLVEKWGFEYKTVGFTWAKTNKNRINNFASECDLDYGAPNLELMVATYLFLIAYLNYYHEVGGEKK